MIKMERNGKKSILMDSTDFHKHLAHKIDKKCCYEVAMKKIEFLLVSKVILLNYLIAQNSAF